MAMSKRYIHILFSELITPLELEPCDRDVRIQEAYLDLDLANELLMLNSNLEVQKYELGHPTDHELGYSMDRSFQRRFWIDSIPIREAL